MSTKRALHFVFKVGDRTATARFYRDVLGMKFLRHEEFEKGCEAACNGPYDGKWSKSMVGYGPEDDHFVVELTYNYGIGSYKLGNDFRGITIHSKDLVDRAKAAEWPVLEEDGKTVLEAPGGYKFFVVNEEAQGDPVKQVSLSASDLSKSVEFWNKRCGMKIYSQTEKSAILGYADNQCKLELVDVGEKLDRASAFGRTAFSCPEQEVEEIEAAMKAGGETILTPLVRLDTPGKATVTVVIVADPDGHEICFVGDKAFRELSQVDPKADAVLDEAIKNDKSDEWFAKKGKKKAVAPV